MSGFLPIRLQNLLHGGQPEMRECKEAEIVLYSAFGSQHILASGTVRRAFHQDAVLPAEAAIRKPRIAAFCGRRGFVLFADHKNMSRELRNI